MSTIEIYTKAYCPYCDSAKALLQKKGVSYREFDITANAALRQEMQTRSGRVTVPQIFIDGLHIGGSDDLAASEASGALDTLLGTTEALSA